MSKVVVKRKVVDAKTGSTTYEKVVKEIDPKEPYYSIEFHKVADLMGIDAYRRTIPYVYEKVAILYNYMANILETNDVDRIVRGLDKLAKDSELTHLGGQDLLKRLYRIARMDMDNQRSLEKAKEKVEHDINVRKERAEELRKTSEITKKEAAKESKQADTFAQAASAEIEKRSQVKSKVPEPEIRKFKSTVEMVE